MDEKFTKKGMQRTIAENNIFPLSEKERLLSENLFSPFIENLKSEFQLLRNRLDKVILSRRKEFKKGSRNLEYPLGFCREISSLVLMDLKGNFSNPENSLIHLLKKFEKKGGLIKHIWGIQHEKNFHNVIVAGNYVIDVSNDTVDVNKDKVEISTLENSGFRNIESFEDYGIIVEKYWNDEIFPNIYLPHLASIFPIILVRSWGQVELCGADLNLTSKNTLSEGYDYHFQLSKDFLTKSKFANKRLPVKIENLLYNTLVDSKVQSSKFKYMLEFCSGGDLPITLSYLSQFKNLKKDNFSPQMEEYIKNQCGTREFVIYKQKDLVLPKKGLDFLIENGDLIFN